MSRKNKQNWLLVFVASVAMSFVSTTFAAEIIAEDEYTKGLINEEYNKQTVFTCNKQKFQIPPYFPFGDKFVYNNKPPASDLYLTAQEKYCTPDYFNVILGLSPNCMGQNICINGSFSYSKVVSSVINEIRSAFSIYTKEIELNKNLIGYFVPSQCDLYCSTARLIWFDYNVNKIFIISTKNPQNTQKVIDELVKSANSYINSQK